MTRTLATFSVLLMLVMPAPASGQCSDGTYMGACYGPYTEEGCCEGVLRYWCEGPNLCRLSCNSEPYCGWNSGQGQYTCATGGGTAPGNSPPMDCNDRDGDGYSYPTDCDDDDASVHPGAVEDCDGVDDDCDGHVDNGFDDDQDGWSSCMGDCDNDNANIHPGATETPYDGIDQDCDGSDLDDVDNDGYVGGGGGDDCNDNDPDINPGVDERCTDNIDNDCDGFIDTTDPDCSGDDDTLDDDDSACGELPCDDDTAADDDTDLGLTVEEPFGFGCTCRAVSGRTTIGCLVLLLGIGWHLRLRRNNKQL